MTVLGEGEVCSGERCQERNQECRAALSLALPKWYIVIYLARAWSAQDGKLKGYGKAGAGSRQKREVTFDNGAVYNGEWLVSSLQMFVCTYLRATHDYDGGLSPVCLLVCL